MLVRVGVDCVWREYNGGPHSLAGRVSAAYTDITVVAEEINNNDNNANKKDIQTMIVLILHLWAPMNF